MTAPVNPEQRPVEVYDPGLGAGFNFLHEPKDDAPCDPDEAGRCHNVDHLWPIAKPTETV